MPLVRRDPKVLPDPTRLMVAGVRELRLPGTAHEPSVQPEGQAGEEVERESGERSREVNREEAIRIFRKEIECLSHTKCSDCRLKNVCDPISTTPLDSEYIAAFSMAINALSAIEDIKAEINEFIKNPQFGDLDIGASCGAVKCLEIIDKHISGKENE